MVARILRAKERLTMLTDPSRLLGMLLRTVALLERTLCRNHQEADEEIGELKIW